MAFRTTTLERMDTRVHELIRGFSNFQQTTYNDDTLSLLNICRVTA